MNVVTGLPDPVTCQVLRDGRLYTVNVADLAPGETPYLPALEAADLVEPSSDAPTPPPTTGWASMTVVQLAAACQARSLKVASGARKADLVALLEKAGA